MALIFPNTQIRTNADNNMEFDGLIRSVPSNVPAFKVMNDINANITTSNGRPITWGFTAFDNGNNVSSTTFTAPVDGLYWMNVWMMDDNDGSNINDYLYFRVNGTASSPETNRTASGYSSGASNHHYQWDFGGVLRLYENDAVTVYVYRADTGYYGSSILYTQWSGCYMGRI